MDAIATPRPRTTQLIARTAARLTVGRPGPRERALAIFTFVRDEIAFGFTPRFDQASPAYTLRHRRGHCNPQAKLMVALLRAVGVRARFHVVSIPNTVLDGLFSTGLPARLDHAFVELELDGKWIAIDGYIVDPPLMRGAKAKLREDGATMGYGVHARGRNIWDGRNDCMAQFVDRRDALRDFGCFEELDEHFSSPDYGQRLGLIGRLGLSFILPGVERQLARLRADTRASG